MYADAWVYAAGGLVASVLLSRPLIRSAPDSMMVANHHGRPVPAVGGLVVSAAVLSITALAAVIDRLLTVPLALAPSGALGRGAHLVLLAVMGFFALGMVDDLAGAGQAKGFRGHLGALRRGRVTGGLIKAGGGGLLALSVAAAVSDGPGRLFVDAALIALTANLFNLLDLRPGRAGKWYLLSMAAVLFGVATLPSVPISSGYLQIAGACTGAVAGWLPKDLRAKGMLGDSGANLLGGVVGLGAAASLTDGGAMAVLAVLVVLTAVSERYSFTAIIEAVPPLRWFDNLGRDKVDPETEK